jgi:hypothetical protein
MHEDFVGNTLGTAKALELTSSLQTFRGSVSPLDTSDYYGFTLSNHSSFNMTLSGLGANADVELLNSRGEVLQTSAQSGTSSESLFTSLNAGSYYIKVYSSTQATTNYNLNLSAIPESETTLLQNRDAVTGIINPSFDTGVFTVGSSGQVSIDYLFDGGNYQGELAIFSLEGMEQFEGGIDEFIGEAARRALSDSALGHLVISDSTEGARFHGSFFEEPDFNSGEYLGVRTFSMRPGDTFGVMLVPDGTVQQVSENPGVEGAIRPLFSLSTANPDDAFHVGQIADATGNGDTFIFEDLRVDTGSDYDYNDIIFRVRGATGEAILLDDVIDPAKDWRDSDMGRELLAYADASINFDSPQSNQPLVGIIDTGFNANNPDIDYSRIILGRDRIDEDNNPLLQTGEGNEHGTHVLGIIGATRGNGLGIDGINDQAPIWLGRAVGSGQWAESLVEFVDAAKASGQPNAVVNLSFDLTQTNPDGSVTTRYELTPQERQALEYARQNNVLIVAAAGNDGGTMSALGQASQEFENIITVGSVDYSGNRADYSSYGYGLDLVAYGGTSDEPAISTVGSGADLEIPNGAVDTSEDEMAAIARTTFEEVFGFSSDAEASNTGALEVPENLTLEERQAYEEAIQEIDTLLLDYLDAASAKISLELLDKQFAAGIESTNRILDAFDGDLADTLVKAQEILGNDVASAESSTSAIPDFSVALDLGVGEMAGTSVAAAKVTGAVSQVWAANPGLSFAQVKDILKKTAVNLNAPGWDLVTGAGLVAIAAAVELAKRTQPESYEPKPLLSPFTWGGAGQVTPGERAASTVSVPTFTGRIMNAGYVSTIGFLRIRSGPGQNYAEVGRKVPGDAVDFDAYDDNGSFVPDPSMPGGGSSRWYRIAGTNTWMSALYIDNTPERAEEERRRQEEIRRAEEEARRAEEEARRAEEEARRAEEELRRLEEEERRRQEQLQSLITEVSQKVGDLGLLIGSVVSNGVAIYQFDKGTLYVQPNGLYSFYEVGKEVLDKVTGFAETSTDFTEFVYKKIVNPKGFLKTLDSLPEITRVIPANVVLDAAIGTREFFINGKGKSVLNFTRSVAKVSKPIRPLIKAMPYLNLAFTVGDVVTAQTEEEKRRASLKAGAALLAGGLGAVAGGVFGFGAGAVPVAIGAATAATTIMDGVYFGADILGLGDELDNAIGNSFSAVSSFTNSAANAAREQAQAAAQKAKELAEQAKAKYESAKAYVQQAQSAYQGFKAEVQKATTQIVQQSQQRIQEEARRIAQTVAQKAPTVVKYVANYAQRAVQTVNNVINGAKQFVSNVIETGKQIVNKVIETGKQAYETVKNFVVDTYEKGKQTVTQAVTTAANTVSNVISGGANMVKSFFSW